MAEQKSVAIVPLVNLCERLQLLVKNDPMVWPPFSIDCIYYYYYYS